MYYPVRKAASSSLTHALLTRGGTQLTWRTARKLSGFHFSLYRSPYRRMRSLYVRAVFTQFYQPFAKHNIHTSTSFPEFIELVCALNPSSADEHLIPASWHTIIPRITIYPFYELDILAQDLGIPIDYVGHSADPDLLARCKYNDHLYELMNTYFRTELAELSRLGQPLYE